MFVRVLQCVCVLVLVLQLSACATNVAQRMKTPIPWGLEDIPDGPPEFRKGWEDGCHTGIGAYGNAWYRMFYTYKQDANMVGNPTYYRAWKDAYTYCRWYTEQWVKPWN